MGLGQKIFRSHWAKKYVIVLNFSDLLDIGQKMSWFINRLEVIDEKLTVNVSVTMTITLNFGKKKLETLLVPFTRQSHKKAMPRQGYLFDF